MKVALPHWQGRVSPVLDVAENLLVVELAEKSASDRQEVVLSAADPLERARQVAQAGVAVLICGAVSWPLEVALAAAGVQVIAHVCGSIDEVLTAFQSGRLTEGAFVMPGCCGRRRRFRGGRNDAQGKGNSFRAGVRRPRSNR